jgi:hypothetical protein
MPTAYRPLSNVSNYAALDSSATGALTRGMALAVVSWPTGSTDLPKVKGCADGTRPDGVVLDAIDLGATGRFAPRCAASSAFILGGSVMAGDLLKVSAGKWLSVNEVARCSDLHCAHPSLIGGRALDPLASADLKQVANSNGPAEQHYACRATSRLEPSGSA